MAITDDFNRADGGLGANWTTVSGALEIRSNRVNTTSATNGTYGWAVYSGSGWNSNQRSDVLLAGTVVDGGAILNAGSGPDGYMAMGHTILGMRIYRRDDGAFTLLTDIGGTMAAGNTVGLGRSGSTLTYYKDGVSQGTASDATYSGGAPGIYDSTHDAATPHLDDWEGTGEVAATGNRRRRFFIGAGA